MKIVNPTGHKRLTINQDEVLNITLEDFEPGSRDFNLEIELLGPKAVCHVRGRIQTQGEDRKSWRVAQTFRGTDQTGSIQLKGTAEDESFLEFDGSGTLTNSSVDAQADIEERIILFDQAKGKSLPILRVETDRVAGASHGASIAPVDTEKILYLQSRGVNKKSAETLLKDGFLQ